METPTTRICPHCKKEKPLEDFPASKTHTSGHKPTCRECINSMARESYARRKMLTPPDLGSQNPRYKDLSDQDLIAHVKMMLGEPRALGYIYEGKLQHVRTIRL